MSASKAETYQQNVRQYEAGQLKGLMCPRCRTPTVSVRFAPPPTEPTSPSTVYFACSKCGDFDTAQYRGKPPHFEEELVQEG